MTNRGAQWLRWEPHIHAPGTVMNDHFKGITAWPDYLTAIEEVSPALNVVAVTDYYVTETYEQARRHQENGRLKSVQLLLPNVELRLDVAAKKGFVNLHLIVCPDDDNHVEELKHFLKRLTFRAFNDTYDCSVDDLIRLGKRSNPSISDDRAALKAGAEQFKVGFNALRDAYRDSA
ncbi:putative ATPase involved in DNA repair [Ahrensia sp. R2A130]|nr:hypothetical protein [Ahrensia sp. R2A130]EFL90938.1 putative ATPase involved in DNA repair [Ahrensia sp. R2A130]